MIFYLIVAIHHLEAPAGLVLLHITQSTLQTENHIICLLNHLQTQQELLSFHHNHVVFISSHLGAKAENQKKYFLTKSFPHIKEEFYTQVFTSQPAGDLSALTMDR